MAESQASTIVGVVVADENHRVLSVASRRKKHLKAPCPGCPWRRENAGNFPANAFRASARTAYDASMHTFACHEAGTEKVATCAGFLLRNADNNIGVRLAMIRGELDPTGLKDPVPDVLFDSYREMAVANGVPPDDPALALCRANGEPAPMPVRR